MYYSLHYSMDICFKGYIIMSHSDYHLQRWG